MKIAEIRRKINDSNIGQKANSSALGIIVEGLSRTISDSFKLTVEDEERLAGIAGRVHPALGFYVGMNLAIMAMEDRARESNIEGHYSHTSPLWRKVIADYGEPYMERVSVKEALYKRGRIQK